MQQKINSKEIIINQLKSQDDEVKNQIEKLFNQYKEVKIELTGKV